MEIFYCPHCEGRPYTDNIKSGSKCPVCGTVLRYEDVSGESLTDRKKIEYPSKKKKADSSKVKKQKEEKVQTVYDKYRKAKTISGNVENIRPCREDPRSLFTKIRHYIMYGQSFSDTLYSFEISPRDDLTGKDKIRVHIYGDYYGDGATICSGFDHTVSGHMAIKNVSENDNDIFFARKIRNTECRIKFVSSPAAFLITVFVLFFFFKIFAALKTPFAEGKVIDFLREVFEEFIPSATAATCMFVAAFLFTSLVQVANKAKTHIEYNFNTIAELSLMMTVLFFMEFKLSGFTGLSISESFSYIFAVLVSHSVYILAAFFGALIIWKVLRLIYVRIRG